MEVSLTPDMPNTSYRRSNADIYVYSKHMDKHERPYRCLVEGCENLPGFTYSGGLLRHEREVHGKHGGPKTQLMCNYPDCKRKNKGFTRKENLNEHIRRVHSKESQSQISMKRDGTDVSAIAGALQDDGETPSRYSESGFEHDESLVSPTQQPKRRRLNSNVEDQTEVQLLRSDNAELRAQVAEMVQQVQQLQEMVQAQQQQMHQNAQPQLVNTHTAGHAGYQLSPGVRHLQPAGKAGPWSQCAQMGF